MGAQPALGPRRGGPALRWCTLLAVSPAGAVGFAKDLGAHVAGLPGRAGAARRYSLRGPLDVPHPEPSPRRGRRPFSSRRYAAPALLAAVSSSPIMWARRAPPP